MSFPIYFDVVLISFSIANVNQIFDSTKFSGNKKGLVFTKPFDYFAK